jgi:UDP-N-acetylmuramoyl-L-alanyl-D-glutamate--2,6-diaminopimelate ligase
MQLHTLLKDLGDVDHTCTVTGLSLDSRKTTEGQLFIAPAIADPSALTYVKQAIARGACAVIYDPKNTVLSSWLATTPLDTVAKNTLFVAIEELAANLGTIAARFHAQPSSKLEVIGITGTNGKTSCSQFLGQLLDHCGIIGTLGWGTWGNLTLTGYTTPDAVMTQALLAEFVSQKQRTVAMEVSSHGIAEGRVNGVGFKGLVLTNISRDHLDFHGSMAAYIATKQALFTRNEAQFAVFNLNDTLSEPFIAVVPEQVVCWGFSVTKTPSSAAQAHIPLAVSPQCIVTAHNMSHHADGLAFDLHWQNQLQSIKVPLYGEFNVENILAVATVLLALGQPFRTVAAKLQSLKPVNGRMQRLGNNQSALVFVDYAHTPDALEKALSSARQHCKHALWVVFGCGGDRDTGKRPQMGACAQRYADHVIITDDNPRTENPETITQDILSGCQGAATDVSADITVIHDRSEAILSAIKQASVGDCIVIAGKGHEHYQEVGAQKIPFNDADVVITALANQAVAP